MTKVQILFCVVTVLAAYGWGRFRGNLAGQVSAVVFFRQNTKTIVQQALLELKVEDKLKEYDPK